MARKALDLHCDTLMKLPKSGNLDEKKNMVTLEGLQSGGVALQCFADFVPTGIFPKGFRKTLTAVMFNKLYKNYRRMMETHSDILFPVLTAADIDRAGVDGKIGVLLTIEDGGVLGEELDNVKKFYDKGVRLVTLTWNHPNAIGYPNSNDSEIMCRGLTDFGREVVREMERLGMVVDVSHVSDGVFWNVAEIARKPFLASHSNSRTVCNHKRNMTDEMIKKLADCGGVMGLNLGPEFLAEGSEDSRVEDMVKHILHIRNIAGIDVLALGSDFDGVHGNMDIHGPESWPKLEAALLAAGLSEDELDKIWWANAERVLRAVLV